ncbi:uncharacterized protein Dana_GF12016, isoform B [Drosophila ananassae]|uniref:Uncharacterized protein, isoform B n=1 Tax=Drosophila ananassae TaxID=7217 RepID=A0A0P8XNE7_DROAN|nr:protein eiger isoform X1 [Drosophila ananassae]KPU76155.1 uncharacterized protein Dana_GF12016, isoform B [Drosophila ananassae]
MTAETLKPFITPTSTVDDFPAKPAITATAQRRTRQLIPLVMGVIGLGLVVAILSLTIWQTTRISHLDKELRSLKRVVDNLQQRLGINYLEELDEFQKEYENALIDYPKKPDGYTDEDEDADGMDPDADDDTDDWNALGEEDDDDDDLGMDYAEYEDMINKLKKEEETTSESSISTTDDGDNTSASSSASNDDNVFEDFTSFNASRKKKDRKSRSIAEVRKDLQSVMANQTEVEEKSSAEAASKESSSPSLHHRRRFRHRSSRQRSLVRKGDSLISAKSVNSPTSRTPAAHFHLTRKVPHHQSSIQPTSYNGDMYIGDGHDGNGNDWQQHFSIRDGVLTVHQPGLYYVYAQICYNNTHDHNGFIIFRGHNAFLQCLNTVPTNMVQKVHTCHTSGIINLAEMETIHLRDIHQDRGTVLRNSNNRSYFGIIKL